MADTVTLDMSTVLPKKARVEVTKNGRGTFIFNGNRRPGKPLSNVDAERLSGPKNV